MEWVAPAVLSAFGQGSVNIMQKKALGKMSSSTFSFLFNFFALIFLIPIIPLVQWQLIPILILLAKSVLTIFGFYFRAKSLKRSYVSEIIPLLSSLNPLFVFILATIFLGEEITPLGISGIFLVILGSVMLVTNLGKIKLNFNFSHILVTVSALFYAISAIINKHLLNTGTNIFTIIFFTTVFTVIGLFFLTRKRNKRIGPALEKNLKILAVSGLITTIYRLLAILAMSLGPISLVQATRRLQSPISVFLGGKILREKDWKIKIIATIIMLIGVYFMVL